MTDARPNAFSRALRPPPVLAAVAALAVLLPACQTAPPPGPPPPPVFPDAFAVVDLTRPLDGDAPFLPQENGFRFERIALGTGADGRHVGAWSVIETMGTHAELPSVFGGEGGTAEALPPSRLVLPLRVLDAPPQLRARDDEGTPLPTVVGVPRILGHEALHGRIPRGAAVVLRTGLGARSSADLDRAGRLPEDAAPSAGWSPEAVRFLAAERGVRLIGTDALTVDATDAGPDAPAARAAAESGLVTLSALTALRGLPPERAVLVVGLLPVEGARAAPARVLALVPPAPPSLAPTDPRSGP